MKKMFCICLFFAFAAQLRAQSLPPFDHIKLATKKDFKQADTTVSQISAYLLATPITRDTAKRLAAAQFLMKWMEGTTDYTFVINENYTRAFINNLNLMAVYVAALSRTALHYKPGVESRKITVDGTRLLIAYINNPANNVKPTPELKDLSDANDKGELETFLNL
jgi:hypothetical protein